MQIVERYGWIGAGAIALTPLPGLDLLGARPPFGVMSATCLAARAILRWHPSADTDVRLSVGGGRDRSDYLENKPVGTINGAVLSVFGLYDSIVGAINALALRRGHNPDVPPHLNKVTETV